MTTVPTQDLIANGGILIVGMLLLPLAIPTLVALVVSARRSGRTAARVFRVAVIAILIEVALVPVALWWISNDPGWRF